MPIYEYECNRCGRIEEAFQNFSDVPLSICKHCSGHLHRIISQSSFHLRGSGWYATDYAKKSKNPESKDNVKPKVKASAKASTNKETAE